MKDKKITLEDIVRIDTRCRVCEAPGMVNTLIWIAEDTTTAVGKQLHSLGYVEVTCSLCMGE